MGILGMTPQDVSDLKAADKLREKFKSQGHQAVCYGMGDGLDEVKKAMVAESAIKMEKWWRKTPLKQ